MLLYGDYILYCHSNSLFATLGVTNPCEKEELVEVQLNSTSRSAQQSPWLGWPQ